jgi:trimethylguanosine synthase
MTDSSYFEVTPEPIAHAITTHVTKAFPSSASLTIVDAFCGVGGNSIQFALSPRVRRVIATETDTSTIDCARHNAKIYGVSEKIDFINCDFFELVEKRLRHEDISAVFLSPPWGGPEYRSDEVFDLEKMQPYSASTIIAEARRVSDNIGLYVPRTSDLNQLAALTQEGKTVQAVHCCVARKSKVRAPRGKLRGHY